MVLKYIYYCDMQNTTYLESEEKAKEKKSFGFVFIR